MADGEIARIPSIRRPELRSDSAKTTKNALVSEYQLAAWIPQSFVDTARLVLGLKLNVTRQFGSKINSFVKALLKQLLSCFGPMPEVGGRRRRTWAPKLKAVVRDIDRSVEHAGGCSRRMAQGAFGV